MPHQLATLLAVKRLAHLVGRTSVGGATLAMAQVRGRWTPEKAANVSQVWARTALAGLGVRVRVHGTAVQDATMLVANHRSYLDIPLLVAAQPCAFLAKREITKWPLFGACARLAGTMFVDRDSSESRENARLELRHRATLGQTVALFPEGTTVAGPALATLHKGAFHIASDAAVTVAPIAIVYGVRSAAYVLGDSFLPHFLKLFRRRRVVAHISFGPPLTPDTALNMHRQASEWLATEVDRLESIVSPR